MKASACIVSLPSSVATDAAGVEARASSLASALARRFNSPYEISAWGVRIAGRSG